MKEFNKPQSVLHLVLVAFVDELEEEGRLFGQPLYFRSVDVGVLAEGGVNEMGAFEEDEGEMGHLPNKLGVDIVLVII